jgi:NADPH-dependent 2,4-dienoyl-CoA reductase/sulfur reductase-like enzyme
MQDAELVVIGGGPGGLAAAHAAYAGGLADVIVLERSPELGGILPQCIHNGFGLQEFKEDLTGPEYAQRYIDMLSSSGVDVRLNTMVLGVTEDKVITAVSPDHGLYELKAKAVVLAMGCRERTRGAIGIPGSRPAGVFTAGTAQRFINIHGYMPGRKAVILGSGDVGLIMARRMVLEGAEVAAVLEIRPYLTGLMRNKIQCLDDFGIPLRLQTTITHILGRDRVEAVTVAEVDDDWKPVPGTEERIECDTVLTSVGLIPENELSTLAGVRLDTRTGGPVVDQYLQTSIPGIFTCGNVLLVNDLVDDVSRQGALAGRSAVHFIRNKPGQENEVEIGFETGRNIHSIGPQKLRVGEAGLDEPVELFIRCQQPETDVQLWILSNDEPIAVKKYDWVGPGEMIKYKLKLKDGQVETVRKTGAGLQVELVGQEAQ